MDESLEHHGRFLPAEADTAIVLQPANGSFNRPAAFVSTQLAPVLSLVFGFAIGAVRGNHFHAPGRQLLIEPIRVQALSPMSYCGKSTLLIRQ